MTYLQLRGDSITESFLNQTGNLGNLNATAQTWTTANNTIYTNGQFIDTLSSSSTPTAPRYGTAAQEFTATGQFGTQPLDILFGGISFSGVNENVYSKNLVTINGLKAQGPCSGARVRHIQHW